MKTKLYTLLLAVAISVTNLFADAVKIGEFYYNLDPDSLTAEVTYLVQWSDSNYAGMTSADIPSSVNFDSKTYIVTSIDHDTFYGCNSLISVSIPSSVKNIAMRAFGDCSNLAFLNIPNGVTNIEGTAFTGCSSLTSITIPKSVTSIGNSAFANCSNLQSIIVETGNSEYDSRDNCNAIIQTSTNTLIAGCQNTIIPNGVIKIGNQAFWGCSNLISISFPNSVTSIESEAFYNCSGLTSVNFSNNLTSIGGRAFFACEGLTSITIPNSVTKIEKSAFDGCSGITSMSVENGNVNYDSRENCNAIIETESNTLIAGCQNTIIPNSVTSIGELAFGNCINLTSITLPNSITSIEEGAFFNCSNITSIIIPSNVTRIGVEAFEACRGLTSIVIPNKVTSIGGGAFLNCTNLTSITIPNSVMSIGANTFYGCKSLISVTIPVSVKVIEKSTFQHCSKLASVAIPNCVSSIGDYAFDECSMLANITCEAVTPPTCGENVFAHVQKSISLYVPRASIDAYKAAEGWSEFTNIQAIYEAPSFPGDPGTITYKLQLGAAVIGGDSLPDYTPAGAGGYAVGTSVTITAQDIPGYQFVQWSDSVTDKSRSIVIEQSTSLTAYYNRSQIEIAVAANAWTFFCLPAVGKPYSEEMFEYVGLTNVKWGAYNGGTRAAGKSGWETPENFNAQQGYIIYSTTAGTLRINAYETDLPSGDVSVSIVDYSSSQPENAGWNFLGNPYSQGYSIAGLAAAGIESPITVWNGTGYDTYTPGIDTYILQPFEAFFIQKAEGGAEAVTFDSSYLPVEGTLSGYFSVSDTTKVRFSKGNLQYRASTNTWRFAEHQYDTIGVLNSNISNSYDGWIDLFGWGTGDRPTFSSQNNNDYKTFVDWGINSISNGGNSSNIWHTLLHDEYYYLFFTRKNAALLFGLGSVNGVNGLILLPDDWETPDGVTFEASTTKGLAAQGKAYSNSNLTNYSHNIYTADQWILMENAGAVFMPASGERKGTDVTSVNLNGHYWSSMTMVAYFLDFNKNNCSPLYQGNKFHGQSVRLVR